MIISSAVPPDAMLSAWTGFLEADILLTLIIQSLLSFVSLFLMPFGLPFLFEHSSYFSLRILIKNLFFSNCYPFCSCRGFKNYFSKVSYKGYSEKTEADPLFNIRSDGDFDYPYLCFIKSGNYHQ
ncbi:hypothetical protein ES705_33043 [subsurface metagenome]